MTAHAELNPWYEIPFDCARHVVVAVVPPYGGSWDWRRGNPPDMKRVDLSDASLCEDHSHAGGWCAIKDGVHYGLPRLRTVIRDLEDQTLGAKA